MPASRAYEIRLPGDWPPERMDIARPSEAVVGNEDRHWRFEGNTLTTVIYVGRTALTTKAAEPPTVKVQVFRSEKLMARRSELNGFAGKMARLNEARYTMQHLWPFSDVPDELVDAAQTGDRIGYYPNTAGEQIAHLHEVMPKVQAKIDALVKAGISETQKQVLAKALGPAWETPEAKAAVADYPNKVARALAEINDAMGTNR
jgi:alpha-glucosidase